MVITLKNKVIDHYTSVESLFKPLFSVMVDKLGIELQTDSCTDGDHGFAAFLIKGLEGPDFPGLQLS